MSNLTYYAPGDHNAICFECGKKFKASQMKKHWQGYHVCGRCWEPRQPQDFVRAVADVQTPPWVQPVPEDRFIWESTAGLITTDTTLTDTTTTANGGTAANGGINGDGVITITLPTTPATAQRIEIGNVGDGTVVVEGSVRKDTTVYVGVRLTPGARIWLVWGGTYWEWENEIRYSITTTYIITTVIHATWSISGSSIVLSEGNLVATYTYDTPGEVASTITKLSGKWYGEVTVAATLMDFIASTPGATSTIVANGQVVGFAIDADADIYYLYVNNVLVKTGYGQSGALGITMSEGDLEIGCTGTLTANFGATTFAYSPPSGYDYGLYTETIYVWYLV